MIMSRSTKIIFSLILSFLFLMQGGASALAQSSPHDTTTTNDAGMWLLPQIDDAVYAEMQHKGLELPADTFYKANKPSLNQAIVRINIGAGGGGTGSFVSDEGLVLTNHHVAYEAIASVSDTVNNYLKNGFYAETEEDEIPVPEYNLFIPIEQTEVTDTLNAMVPDSVDAAQRQKVEQKMRGKLINDRKKGDKDLKVEIHDFWAGNRQYMIVYRIIRDIRLAYAPPESVGKYGGDIDNWMWPRHTGDYSFLRAYVGSNGSGKEYDEDNIPFKPSVHLPISKSGVKPGDVTMTLGFPGSTYRYESSYAFEFYENHRNEYIIGGYQAISDALSYRASQSEEQSVAVASREASVNNVLKLFKGIQEGFKRYDIVNKKRQKETEFAGWIDNSTSRQNKYGGVLDSLDKAFKIASRGGDKLYATNLTLQNNSLLDIAGMYGPFYSSLKDDSKVKFTDQDIDSVLRKHRAIIDSVNVRAQTIMLKGMLSMLENLPEHQSIDYVENHFASINGKDTGQRIDNYISKLEDESIVLNPDKAEDLLGMWKIRQKRQDKDELVKLSEILTRQFGQARAQYSKHIPILQKAREKYVLGMKEFRNDSTEYPDANFTLRMSLGRVMGYEPEDGLKALPFTTFEGMIAKDTDEKPFDTPEELEEYYSKVSNSPDERSEFATEDNRLIVNFLSTNDITGGNSGSPVLNGYGQLVGLAFDGNIEGVVGDYYYDPELNRMISADARYILFLMKHFDEADRLYQEIDIVETPSDTKSTKEDKTSKDKTSEMMED